MTNKAAHERSMNDRTILTRAQAKTLGFLVDTTTYPWFGYKGPRFRPTESVSVWTDREALLYMALVKIDQEDRIEYTNGRGPFAEIAHIAMREAREHHD
jgi:hypothetical protein